MSKRKNDKPPLRCFDCIWCEVTGCWETYWSRYDGPHYCEDCGKELTERKNEVPEHIDTEIYEEGEEERT